MKNVLPANTSMRNSLNDRGFVLIHAIINSSDRFRLLISFIAVIIQLILAALIEKLLSVIPSNDIA